ncbi:hypothetical protein HJG60_012056 [Phyllostomus discolor]|uniref:Uncharacterized protein n=1 Tax=Phyllostomus discolor TaxID=89673 RepID=A0A833ZDQ2_9CHIR|nr:hypothetical protein HJG60_012056 [Phyllostomus discolor]
MVTGVHMYSEWRPETKAFLREAGKCGIGKGVAEDRWPGLECLGRESPRDLCHHGLLDEQGQGVSLILGAAQEGAGASVAACCLLGQECGPGSGPAQPGSPPTEPLPSAPCAPFTGEDSCMARFTAQSGAQMVNLKPCLGHRIFICLAPVVLISGLYMSEGFVLWLGHVLHQAA